MKRLIILGPDFLDSIIKQKLNTLYNNKQHVSANDITKIMLDIRSLVGNDNILRKLK